MSFKIIIYDGDKKHEVEGETGKVLLDYLQNENTSVHAPCGGRGTCKKCMVEISGKGKVLSCQTLVSSDLTDGNSEIIEVTLPLKTKPRILSEGKMPSYKLNPLVNTFTNKISVPSVHDQAADDVRIEKTTGYKVSFQLLTELSKILRDNSFGIEYTVRNDIPEISCIRNISDKNSSYGIAIDIGTTTVAGFLYNLDNGMHIKTASCLNSQKIHGADVISRIDFADSSLSNLKKLQKLIHDDIMQIIYELAEKVEDIKLLSFAGNTTMMHLLCGINPIAIAKSPFIPTTLSARRVYFSEIFTCIDNKLLFNPVCILLPSISGYVGADITAGLLSCDMDDKKKTALLVDIGTNGEIALSVKGKVTACSTAAGPAFEGANLSCGIGGVIGAIDKVSIENNEVRYRTISDYSPVGICGSGIVSAISSLLSIGVIDETGRFEDDIEGFSSETKNRIININGETAYVFHFDPSGEPSVYITQKDIREVQNAKAAVCAGVEILMEKEALKADDIESVYISGGFGNYLNIDDAFSIGLLPVSLKGKTKMTGNTSVTGAALCLLDKEMLKKCEDICHITRYYELSSDKRFSDLYIDAMLFEPE